MAWVPSAVEMMTGSVVSAVLGPTRMSWPESRLMMKNVLKLGGM
jgi:hypothetical protein